MPRKTKEQKELENEKKVENKAKKKTTSTSAKPKATKATKTKTSTSTSTKKKTTTKKKNPTKQVVKKSTVTTTKKKAETKNKKNPKEVDIVEYYDLPYRYNQTIVRVLAQTPNNLFIYWDISDKDRKNFEKQYGKNFFETTKPVLIIYNDTMHYKFEIEINDFANSWYLHVADSKCDYRIELGRRPIINAPEKTEELKKTNYIYITTSNGIESPNDRILFDKQQKTVFFRDVKTGVQTQKTISSISFIQNMGKFYDIYDIYNAIYPNENIEKLYDLNNPSSGGLPSSGNVTF